MDDGALPIGEAVISLSGSMVSVSVAGPQGGAVHISMAVPPEIRDMADDAAEAYLLRQVGMVLQWTISRLPGYPHGARPALPDRSAWRGLPPPPS